MQGLVPLKYLQKSSLTTDGTIIKVIQESDSLTFRIEMSQVSSNWGVFPYSEGEIHIDRSNKLN